MTPTGPTPADEALLELLSRLEAAGYDFVSPTPAVHKLVSRRRKANERHALRDILGWGRLFDAATAPPWLLKGLGAADALAAEAEGYRARLRVSRLAGRLHLHSASSREDQAVFLGPDSYRYVRFLRQALADHDWRNALEIGVGAGAGALAIAGLDPEARVTATDINPAALRLARVNARHACLSLDLREGDLPERGGRWDLIAANPPYIEGRAGKLYRDGGGQHGAEVALDWTRTALDRLAPGGRFILYTGAPIVEGEDLVRLAAQALADRHGARLDYDEIDPDVFGSSLSRPGYAAVERIAAVGAVFTL
ncbi:methyltransferase [Brevundimonas sp.]|uniref:methyltransferase n=1 Tax=Brevundimonas sp. TaxID=1871086 RepID=UPI00289762CF|nr:methyltransferase [Brevundimonas sp.]